MTAAANHALIDTERLLSLFGELVAVDSESFHERRMADVLKRKLKALGAQELTEDGTGAKIGSDAGNLFAVFPGTMTGEPLLFSGHMDTVAPGIGKRAIRQADGRITSDGTTVLGADDMAGVAAILEALRALDEQGIPRRTAELLLTTAEEAYIRGASAFDYAPVRAREAYVLDISGPAGAASLQEPTLLSFRIVMNGRAAHAGFAPEDGAHAIAMAARLIEGTRMGRLDENTTVNVGTIHGGKGTNIVPPQAVLEGEIRSFVHEEALAQLTALRERAQAAAAAFGGSCDFSYRQHLHAYRIAEDEPVVRRFLRVCREAGAAGTLTRTFGGSDNNAFYSHGIHGIVLSCGMYGAHTTGEYTTADDLTMAARLVAGLMTSEE